MLAPGDIRWFDEIDSTNRALLDEARAGAAEGLVFAADHQTAGRGRLDRTWQAPPGSSLLVSVLLRPRLPPAQAHATTVVVGIAASDAVDEVAGFRPGLKWPNDLVHDDRKLGGILAEAIVEGGEVAAVVVGMGLNVNWPELPAELADTATACNLVVGHEVDRTALLHRFLDRLREHYAALREPGGWRRVVIEERRRSATLGRDVRVDLPGGRVVEGRAVDLTEDGHLVVETGDGDVTRVSVGDVVHARPTGPASG